MPARRRPLERSPDTLAKARARGGALGAAALRREHAAPGRGHPQSSDRLYDEDECEFLKAIEAYKKRTGRPFPTWSEVLGVVRELGYRKAPAP